MLYYTIAKFMPYQQTARKSQARKGSKKSKVFDDEFRSEAIDKADMDNERFKAYYQAQNLVPEEEWQPFYDALKQHLPTTFRVAGSRR